MLECNFLSVRVILPLPPPVYAILVHLFCWASFCIVVCSVEMFFCPTCWKVPTNPIWCQTNLPNSNPPEFFHVVSRFLCIPICIYIYGWIKEWLFCIFLEKFSYKKISLKKSSYYHGKSISIYFHNIIIKNQIAHAHLHNF